MRISLHAGNCCGIKCIHGLSYYPDTLLAARKVRKMTSFGQKASGGMNDMMHSNPRGKHDFFNEAAPKESYKDRLKRFVEFIKDNRYHGLIEIVLNPTQKVWIPIIEEMGFKKITVFKNSNTGSTLSVYHLIY